LVRDVALPLARGYEPQLILISAGYDAHDDDPLADCAVTDDGFVAMTALMRDLGAELEVPVGCVLEGGYDVDALARCVALTMQTLAEPAGGGGPAADGEIPVHRFAEKALERLAPFWPQLGR
jgi:acetoin utilization deacetylase AcuC-like enzyme